MEEVIYSNNMGEGLILNIGEPLFVKKESVGVAGEILQPETLTTLQGYFKTPLKFCGTLYENKLLFFIGQQDNKLYYQIIHLIAENRLFSMFSHIAGRDFNFIKGRWK